MIIQEFVKEPFVKKGFSDVPLILIVHSKARLVYEDFQSGNIPEVDG